MSSLLWINVVKRLNSKSRYICHGHSIIGKLTSTDVNLIIYAKLKGYIVNPLKG